jgi:hypothetical protein
MSPRIAELMSIWDDKHVTMDELFASLTELLSSDPSELPYVRTALAGQEDISESFETWLRDLVSYPAIAFSSGRTVIVSGDLLAVLAKEEERRLSRGG